MAIVHERSATTFMVPGADIDLLATETGLRLGVGRGLVVMTTLAPTHVAVRHADGRRHAARVRDFDRWARIGVVGLGIAVAIVARGRRSSR